MTESKSLESNDRPVSSEMIRQHAISQEHDSQSVANESMPGMDECMDGQTSEDNAGACSADAITVDDICKSYCLSQSSSMDPMERWTSMAASEECFPLLAKRSMQDAEVDVATPRSSSVREAATSSSSEEVTVQGKAVAAERNMVATIDETVEECREGDSQQQPTLATGSNITNSTRGSKPFRVVARYAKGRQQSRWLKRKPIPSDVLD